MRRSQPGHLRGCHQTASASNRVSRRRLREHSIIRLSACIRQSLVPGNRVSINHWRLKSGHMMKRKGSHNAVCLCSQHARPCENTHSRPAWATKRDPILNWQEGGAATAASTVGCGKMRKAGLWEPQDNVRTMGTGKEAGTLSRARRSRGVKSRASVCCRCGYNHCAHWADPHIQPVATSSTAGLRSDSMWRDRKVHEVRVPEPRHVMKCVSTVQEEACSFCGDRQIIKKEMEKWLNYDTTHTRDRSERL